MGQLAYFGPTEQLSRSRKWPAAGHDLAARGYCVVDGFLGDRLAGELLEQVVAMGGTVVLT